MQKVLRPSPLQARPVDGHKGTFGRVLVVGGCESMIGAPVLAGTSALRMGAGLVQIATPASILPAGLSITPELIGLPLSRSSAPALREALKAADVVVIGPGLGQSADARRRVLQILRTDKLAVVDADALNMLSAQKSPEKVLSCRAVLTPHPGEMSRLCRALGLPAPAADERSRTDVAVRVARALQQVVVLKGHGTVVSDGTHFYLNDTGDDSLAKAGTGDVLAGILGALLAGGMERFEASCAAVWIHGKAGELAGARIGRRAVLAGDVIVTIPEATAQYVKRFGESKAPTSG